ncbi:MAG: sensor histidine kinase [Jatrophihabitans sp.]|uniref:sensor histidine kinase n=1 Tax=Jatrophihabitans sp. TaxID=1932789 RepID=UPI003F7DDBD4
MHTTWVLSAALVASLAVAGGLLSLQVWTRRRYRDLLDRARAEHAAHAERQAHLALVAERTRIAREMHDIVAHSLSVMIALADGASATVERDPARARQAMAQAADTGRAALGDMRDVVALLRADTEPAPQRATLHPEPTLADLEALFATVRETGVQVTYSTSGSTESLPLPVQLAVFRLVQEALTNAIKHAPRATRLLVSLRRGDSDLRVVVDDNGGGTAAAEPPGHGLIGMRERLAVHGGRLMAGPTQTGWRVSAWLPLDDDRHAHRRLIGTRG